MKTLSKAAGNLVKKPVEKFVIIAVFGICDYCNGWWGGCVCVDPGEKGAILEAGGPGPPRGGNGWQLASDSGGEET
jgi:hypothetical protein